MVRQVIYTQSTKANIQPGSTNEARWSDKSFIKRSHTIWKCTNKVRGSDRSSMLNQQKVTCTLEMHKQGDMVRQVIHAQANKGHIQPGNAQMRQDGQTGHHAQSTKGHIQPGNAQTRQDSQTGHPCSINKRSHTTWKQTRQDGQIGHSCSINKGHIQTGHAQMR